MDEKHEDKEILEAPSTHKKKTQLFLVAMLGILILVMVVDIVKKSGRSDSPESESPTQAIPTEPQIHVNSFGDRLDEAKRGAELLERHEQDPPQTASQVVAQAKVNRESEATRRGGFSSPQTKAKTPSQIYLEAEQMRVLDSRRSKVTVTLQDGEKFNGAVRASRGEAGVRPDPFQPEQSFVQQELARVQALQSQLSSGQLSASAAGFSGQSGSDLTAKTSPSFEVGQLAAEQDNKPEPGQVLLPTGYVIGAALDQMVMSDVTGPYRAIVTRDVYDPSQRFVLIPAGSKLTGKTIRLKGVNEPIQNRMVMTVSWCILPNGKRISFNKTAALDMQGVAALKDKVSYHLIPQILGVGAYAVLSSSTDRGSSSTEEETSFAGDMGESMREQFAPLASKFLNLVPTVTLRPGTPMHIFIEDDVFITPWDRVYSGISPRAY